MNNISVLGKFLDQPMLVSKFQKAVPAIMVTSGALYTAHTVNKAPKNQKKEKAIRTGITMGVTIASALAAPHIASKISKRALPKSIEAIKIDNTALIDSFVKKTDLDEKTKNILNKGKDKILSFSDVKNIFITLKEKKGGKKFLEKLIPSPETVSAKDIFSEIGYLSIYGAIPVIGGIAGGITADKIVDKNNWKKRVPDKIKEGCYQYLANIFLCNVGAGAALALMEKAGITSKASRALGMTAGIILMGVVGGSKIANAISNKIIDPLLNKKGTKCCNSSNILERELHNLDKSKKCKHDNVHNMYHHHKNIYHKHPHGKKHHERTPELLDIGLHTDDIATVSLLSGLKWIEPALPIMYSLSGYRAGIGYRN